MSLTRMILIWVALTCAVAVPVLAAAASPYLAWRDPIYILAGFAGIVGMGLLLVQPLLAGGYLPGLSTARSRYLHRCVGAALVAAVVIHVLGLWITSPPDVVDALLFVSPTPFSAWGVIAMWAMFAAALLALLRRRLRVRFRPWRLGHATLALVTVVGSVVHVMLIEGTMEIMSKTALCILVLLASAKTLADMRVWAIQPGRGS
ncbi:ferric reductase-like transmembrane domain-containing protein [Rhodobacteraceae bacterium B1Z28]|uniref:Ferric reductase-like transmembrane domain-containing protein n=1 Tax=Ruegeria haliotis TaxID=2747601 RepID=A0ABX2PSV0_9RHOB|nr:ferric reductase-like transmembrane domain-containing protein [Ruegeria haliotis]NVO57255.1 ferric reductase-like transmembrane domain-containing protein [Ruegeria haliotis]